MTDSMPNPAQAETLPARTFTLIIRTTGRLWGGDEVHKVATEQAGFCFGHRRPNLLVLPGVLKAQPVAELHKHGWKSAVRELDEFSLVMDLDKHSAEWRALDKLMKAAKILAEGLNGRIFLADGRLATKPRIEAARLEVSEVHTARNAAEQKAKTTILPDGTVKDWDFVTFDTASRTKRGRYLSRNRFDVPAEKYFEGRARGQLAAKELLLAIRARHDVDLAPVQLALLLEHALQPGSEKAADSVFHGSSMKESRLHAASAFIEVIEVALKAFAKSAEFEKWIDAMVDGNIKSAQAFNERDEDEKREFVARMRAGRERAAAARDAKRKAALHRPASGAATRPPVKLREAVAA